MRIQATANSHATDRMIGPMKRPMMPCASVPPITPMRITSVGVVRPPAHDEWFQDVVDEANNDKKYSQLHCGGDILDHPDPDDHGQNDEGCADLHNRQQ